MLNILLGLVYFSAGAGVESPFLNLAGNFAYLDFMILFLFPSSFKFQKESILLFLISLSLFVLSVLSIIFNFSNYTADNFVDSPFFYSVRFGFYAIVILITSNINWNLRIRLHLVRMFLLGLIFTVLHSWLVWYSEPVYGWGKIPYLTTAIYNPNTLVYYALIYLALDLFIPEVTVLTNIYLKFILRLIFVLTIVFSLSKAGWFILFMLLLLKFYISGFKYFLSMSLVSILVYITLTALLPLGEIESDFVDTFNGRITGSENSNEQRSTMFNTGIRMMMDYPILGIGPKNYRNFTKNYDGIPSRDPHNVFTWIGAELGVFAFALVISVFLVFIFYALYTFVNRKNRNAKWIPFFIVLLLQSFVSGLPLSDKALWYVFPLLLGLGKFNFGQRHMV